MPSTAIESRPSSTVSPYQPHPRIFLYSHLPHFSHSAQYLSSSSSQDPHVQISYLNDTDIDRSAAILLVQVARNVFIAILNSVCWIKIKPNCRTISNNINHGWWRGSRRLSCVKSDNIILANSPASSCKPPNNPRPSHRSHLGLCNHRVWNIWRSNSLQAPIPKCLPQSPYARSTHCCLWRIRQKRRTLPSRLVVEFQGVCERLRRGRSHQV